MVDGLDPISFRLPAHFFGVYDGHGGAQVTINHLMIWLPNSVRKSGNSFRY